MRKTILYILKHSDPSGMRGAAAVEFGILIVILMLILGGIIEFGRVFWHYDALTKATRDGARYLSTASAPLSTDDVTAKGIVVAAATQAGLPDFESDNVTISCLDDELNPDPDCSDPIPGYVTVEIIDYSVEWGGLFPVLTWVSGNLNLRPHTTMRYMCDESGKPC